MKVLKTSNPVVQSLSMGSLLALVSAATIALVAMLGV